jgi:hypothetical protein
MGGVARRHARAVQAVSWVRARAWAESLIGGREGGRTMCGAEMVASCPIDLR